MFYTLQTLHPNGMSLNASTFLHLIDVANFTAFFSLPRKTMHTLTHTHTHTYIQVGTYKLTFSYFQFRFLLLSEEKHMMF